MNSQQIRFSPMKESEWRTTVQSLLEKAAESGEVNLAALAREVGWKPPALHNFRKRGYGDKEKVEKLEERLRQRGFGDPVVGKVVTAKEVHDLSDPADAIALQLEGMAKMLRDKQFDFSTRLAFYREGVAGIERHIMPVAERWLEKIKKQDA